LATGVKNNYGIPTEFSLSQNYPNPFNPATTIRYGLPEKSYVKLEIFNLLGERTAILVDGVQEAAYHEVVFDDHGFAGGLSARGASPPLLSQRGWRGYASGVYFYRLTALPTDGGRPEVYIESKKLILMR
jgi:hypothetical protein